LLIRFFVLAVIVVISFLRTARWISPLRVQSPWHPFNQLVLYAQLPTEVLFNASVPLFPVRCGSPVQSSGQSPQSDGVPLFPFAHGTLALPAESPLSHYPLLGLQSPSYSILGLQTLLFSHISLQTFFFSNLGLQTLFLSNRSSPRRNYADSPRIWWAAGHLLLLLLTALEYNFNLKITKLVCNLKLVLPFERNVLKLFQICKWNIFYYQWVL